jgi:predicted ATPase
LWYLGYPDLGLQKSQESLALATELSLPFSVGFALGNITECHVLRREGQLAGERAEAMMNLGTEKGFPLWFANGMKGRGWALAEQGQVQEGITQMRQGMATLRTIGQGFGRPLSLGLLAEAYGNIGQAEEGLSLLTEALAEVDKTEARRHEAELYRLKGELMLAQSSVQKEAEECFLKAIEIAQRQQAKSLELRATVSLARLWQQRGKKAEAHKLLSEIYNWFTEGFDTKDLQEAKALLEELNRCQS